MKIEMFLLGEYLEHLKDLKFISLRLKITIWEFEVFKVFKLMVLKYIIFVQFYSKLLKNKNYII